MAFAACQSPDQKTVNGPESQAPRFRPGRAAVQIFEHPGQFGPGKIGVENQACVTAISLFQAPVFQVLTDVCCTPTLPDDRVADRVPIIPLPEKSCLALIGNAYGLNLACRYAGFFQQVEDRFACRCPNFLGIVLDPPRFRKMLRKINDLSSMDAQVMADQQSGCAGCSLINRENIFGHVVPA